MAGVKKIAHIEHEENNEAQAKYFKRSTINPQNARIQRINDKLEIALWNLEKHVEALKRLDEKKIGI